ncbi:MAG: S9 family peptidase [Bryobacterales bacterium]|nr:S9 family peptidase [Bryobacterales bacterium]
MPLLRFVLVLPLAGLLCLAQQKKPVTIEAVAAAGERRGIPSVVWAPGGESFAWVEEKRIWSYEIAAKARKELVSLARLEEAAAKVPEPEAFSWRNRNVSEQTFQWAPSGTGMLVQAGGDLFYLHLTDGRWEQLTNTGVAEEDPKLSPDGRLVSFRRNHDLYCLELDARRITRLTHDGSNTLLNGELDWVYPEELFLTTAHWWSPDSRYVAYLQFDIAREPLFPQVELFSIRGKYEPQRYPKAGDPNAEVRAGVVAAQGGPTRWLDLGDPRDSLLARVDWLPNSRGLAIQRLNRIQNRLDLLLAPLNGDPPRLLLREEDRYWVNVDDHLRFLRDGRRFLWSSERTGFRHLYLYGIDGRQLEHLTRGEWEVTEVAGVDEDAGEVFFVSTEQSPLERHFYQVKFNGRQRRRLTTAPGTHTISMSPTREYYLDSHSSLTTPPGRTLHARDGAQLAVINERDRTDAEEYDIRPTEIVTLKAADGTTLYARLIRPAGFQPGRKYPAVVMVYGGPHAQSVRNAWAGNSWDQALAHRGFVVWQVDNRGSAGRGHAFESVVHRNLGARELEDQQEGIRRLVSLGFVDPARLGLYGWSYGGFMTLYTLANAPGLFRAGIAGAPVADWRNYDTIYTERYMGLPSDNQEGYRRSAPLHQAGAMKAELLLVHNFEDDNVHFQNTLQMADALQKAGRSFEMLIYPQKAHGVTGPVRRQMLESLTRFLERYLK